MSNVDIPWSVHSLNNSFESIFEIPVKELKNNVYNLDIFSYFDNSDTFSLALCHSSESRPFS